MDCTPYEKDGVTFVPVRFLTEALGCDVFWDGRFQTAVVLHRDSVAAVLDEDFTVLNRALALEMTAGSEPWKLALQFAATLTQFSTLDGDTTSTFGGSMTLVSGGQVQHLTMQLDLGALLELYLDDPYLYGDDTARLTPFSNLTDEVIYNLDEGVMYLYCPVLMREMGAPEHARLQLALDPEELIGLIGWDDLPEELAALFGDGCFTRQGDTWTLHMDRDDYEMAAYGELPSRDSYYDYQELDIRLIVSDTAVSGSFHMREDGYYSDMLYEGRSR